MNRLHKKLSNIFIFFKYIIILLFQYDNLVPAYLFFEMIDNI